MQLQFKPGIAFIHDFCRELRGRLRRMIVI
jgi:hypothetical protein